MKRGRGQPFAAGRTLCRKDGSDARGAAPLPPAMKLLRLRGRSGRAGADAGANAGVACLLGGGDGPPPELCRGPECGGPETVGDPPSLKAVVSDGGEGFSGGFEPCPSRVAESGGEGSGGDGCSD